MATDARDLMIQADILTGDAGREIPQPVRTMPKVSEFVDATETLYRLTVDEYERIGEYLDDQRVELIDGLLVKKMVQKPPHVVTCELVGDAIRGKTPAGWHVREAKPLRVPTRSEPEPDFAPVRGKARDFVDRHPDAADAALVVEVADSSLAKDRRRRRTYGPAGIPVYWIVNLISRQVEVYARPKGNGYELRTVFKAGQELPLVIDGTVVGAVAVADMLP